jgi:uncharacterized protein
MKLYDFSKFYNERQAAKAVVGVVANINHPGSVIVLKERVQDWFVLHREVLKRASS